MGELTCLELSVLLWGGHIAVQAYFAYGAVDIDYLAGPRDREVEMRGVYYPRATRALRNYVENYTPFAAVDLALIATHQTGGWGAAIWIVARIVYLPLYVMGVKMFRSASWVISILGLLMMLERLAGY